MATENTKRYHRLRQEWIESQGGKCVVCGSADRLEVDHIDRKTKAMSTTQMWGAKEPIRKAELAKCQVLCWWCHKAKTREEGRQEPHGTMSRYMGGKCRCEQCVAAYQFVMEQKKPRNTMPDLFTVSND